MNIPRELDARFAEALDRHAERSRGFFRFLAEAAEEGFTPLQFRIYRDNFFFRTANTTAVVAKVVVAAARHADTSTLASAGKNLFEETGEGDASRAHLGLLERSHNVHGARVFGQAPLPVIEAHRSPVLLPEARAFREIQERLYTSPRYPTVLGASCAQEGVANEMLQQFQAAFFLPYEGAYTEAEFTGLTEYFAAHVHGVEEEHGAEARAAMERACACPEDVEYAMQGVTGFLDAQAGLWEGLLRALRAAGASAIVPAGGMAGTAA